MKISFLRVPRVLFRVLDSFQIVLQISPNTFYSKIKIRKTMALQSFKIIFENFKEFEIFLCEKRKYSKILFFKSLRILFRILDSTQIVLEISSNTFFKKFKIQNTFCEVSRTLNRTLGILKNEIFKNCLKTLKYHTFLNFDSRTKCMCIWTYL